MADDASEASFLSEKLLHERKQARHKSTAPQTSQKRSKPQSGSDVTLLYHKRFSLKLNSFTAKLNQTKNQKRLQKQRYLKISSIVEAALCVVSIVFPLKTEVVSGCDDKAV